MVELVVAEVVEFGTCFRGGVLNSAAFNGGRPSIGSGDRCFRVSCSHPAMLATGVVLERGRDLRPHQFGLGLSQFILR
jgi:hypothetical protein